MQDLRIPLHSGLIPILTLLSLTMLLSVLTMKSIRFRALMCGKPSIIIRDGQIDQLEMRRNRLTVDELLEELRSHGYLNPSEVMYAILETNGMLSVLPHAAQKPATAQQLDIKVQETSLPTVLISDGVLLEQNLHSLGLDRTWLDRQLTKRRCSDPHKVFLMSADRSGVVYFSLKTIP